MFQKQKMMRKVLYSLIPIYLLAIYLYGIRLALLTIVIFPAGFLTEFIFEKLLKKKNVSEAVLVTCALYTLSMPPMVPLWIAGLGIIFAIVFAKEVFGGFGKNPFNPAIAGRLFVYITFSSHMTADFSTYGLFGWGADAISSATPLHILRQGGSINIINHLIGFRTGSIGESSVILIIAAAIYLIITKTASWEIIISTITSGLLLSLIFDIFNIPGSLPFLGAVLSGSFLFIAVFMTTDPVSAPKNRKSKFFFGFFIGAMVIVLRTFNPIFPEATSFAILIGNTFAPLMDEIFNIKLKKADA